MKARRLLIALLLCCMLAFTGVAFAACDSQGGKTQLEGFSVPEQVTAVYGETFEAEDLVVKDSAGNVYEVSVKVTCGGQEVQLTSGKFMIDKMQDYTITYEVRVSDTDVRTLTTVVKVSSTVKPVITVGAGLLDCYEINDTVTLPEVTAKDVSGAVLTPDVEVYLMGETDTKIEVADNSFTATEAGEYELRITATDSLGNKAEEVISFGVRTPAIDYEIESFDSSVSVYNLRAGSYSEDLLSGYTTEQIGGRTGYGGGFAWFSSKNTGGIVQAYPGISLLPRMSKDDVSDAYIEGYTDVIIRMYLDYGAERNVYRIWNGKGTQQRLATLQPRTWTDVRIDITDFFDNYDLLNGGVDENGNPVQLFYIPNHEQETADNTRADITVYIDTIFVAKEETFTIVDGSVADTAETGGQLDVSGLSISLDGEKFSFSVLDPLGNVLPVQDGKVNVEMYGIYTVNVILDSLTKFGSASATVQVTPTVAYMEELITELKEISDPSSQEYTQTAALLSAAYEVLPEADKAKLSLKTDYLFALMEGNKDYLQRPQNEASYIEKFDDPLCALNVSCFSGPTALKTGFTEEAIGGIDSLNGGYAWISSARIDNGAYKEYPGLNFVPRISKAEAQAYLDAGLTKIAMRCYLDGAVNSHKILEKWDGQISVDWILPQTWSVVYFDLARFIAGYDSIVDGTQQMFFIANDTNPEIFTLYIDYIKVVTAEEVATDADVVEGFVNEDSVNTFYAYDGTYLQTGYYTYPVGGKEPSFGSGFWYMTSYRKDNGALKQNPNMWTSGFSMSKETLNTLLSQGYNTLEMTCYLESNVDRDIFEKWSGTNNKVMTLKQNSWNTVQFDLAKFVQYYDEIIQNDKKSVFFISNNEMDESGALINSFRLYVDCFRVGKVELPDEDLIKFTENNLGNSANYVYDNILKKYLTISYWTNSVGEKQPANGGFLKAEVPVGGAPALWSIGGITMTQTQLKAFLDAGMNVLEITVYADSDQTFNAYEKYDGSNVLLGSVKGKEWTTLRIDLQKVYDNYSRLNSKSIMFFWLDEAATAGYNFYIDTMRVARYEEPEAANPFAVINFNSAATADLCETKHSSTQTESGFTTEAVGGESEGYFYYTPTAVGTGYNKEYIALWLNEGAVAMSKERAQALLSAGYTQIALRYYYTATALEEGANVNLHIYQIKSGGETIDLGALQTDKWSYVYLDMAAFVENYDAVSTYDSKFLQIANVGCKVDFTVYFDTMKAENPSSVINFNDPDTAELCETWHSNTQTESGFTTEAVGGESNGYFYYTPTAVGTGYNKEYIALWMYKGAILMSKAYAQELLDGGATKIVLRYYYTATALEESADVNLHIYQIKSGGETIDLGALQTDQWATLELDLAAFIENYDAINTYGSKFLQIANTGCKVDFTICFDTMIVA